MCFECVFCAEMCNVLAVGKNNVFCVQMQELPGETRFCPLPVRQHFQWHLNFLKVDLRIILVKDQGKCPSGDTGTFPNLS